MSTNFSPPEQSACAKLVAGYHGLDEPSRELANATMFDALRPYIVTAEDWLDFFRRDKITMIHDVCNDLRDALDGAEHIDTSDEIIWAIVMALKPLFGDKRTIDALEYDDAIVAGDVCRLLHDALLDEALRNGDQAAIDTLSKPFFSPSEWAARRASTCMKGGRHA